MHLIGFITAKFLYILKDNATTEDGQDEQSDDDDDEETDDTKCGDEHYFECCNITSDGILCIHRVSTECTYQSVYRKFRGNTCNASKTFLKCPHFRTHYWHNICDYRYFLSVQKVKAMLLNLMVIIM